MSEQKGVPIYFNRSVPHDADIVIKMPSSTQPFQVFVDGLRVDGWRGWKWVYRWRRRRFERGMEDWTGDARK